MKAHSLHFTGPLKPCFTAAEGARLDGSMAFTVVEVEMPETLDKHWEFSIKGGNDGDQYVANTKVFEENEGVRKGDKVRSRPHATLQLRKFPETD